MLGDLDVNLGKRNQLSVSRVLVEKFWLHFRVSLTSHSSSSTPRFRPPEDCAVAKSSVREVPGTPQNPNGSMESSRKEKSRQRISRERLDIPDGAGSSAVVGDKLAMLNLSKSGPAKEFGHPGDKSLPSSTFASSDMGRSHMEQGNMSLMDQMVAEATAAQQRKAKDQREEGRDGAKKSFGQGFRKGFLSSSSTTRKSKSNKVKTLDGSIDGKNCAKNCNASQAIAPEAVSMSATDSLPVIDGRKAARGGLEFDISADEKVKEAGLVLPEVQEAMRNKVNEAGSSTGANWLTPELLDKISEEPQLAAMLTDPRFGEALKLMSTNPQEAMAIFASNLEARETFTKLTALLAEHFTSLGKDADHRDAKEEADRKRVAEGPLAQQALRRASAGTGAAATKPSREEQASVDEVLAKPELRELLVDPQMQRVMQECGEPANLARYMRHPEYGPKLKLMAQAGLVSFQS